MTQKWLPWLPAFLWLLIVTGASVTPGVSLPKFDLFSVDKIGHLFAYGALFWLSSWGYTRSSGRRAGWKEGLAIFVLSTAYGIFMEYVQGAFIPGRFYEVDDMIANTAGAAIAWGITKARAPRPSKQV